MPDSVALRPEIQYANLEQQGDTAQLGMWVFLVNETLFFGALIFIYFMYRMTYPHEFAEAAQGERRQMIRWLIATAALGIAFLLVKGYEYHLDFQSKVVPVVNFETKAGEGRARQLFWVFYWVGTGLHAIHLIIGVGLVLYMLLWRIRQGKITAVYYAPLEVVGIYWSFVDVVWLFLYPSIYLVGRS